MKKKPELAKLDGLLWDMDGILVDESKSYRECIILAVNYFLPKDIWIRKSDVDKVKKLVGLNNDWDTSYALYLQSSKKKFDIQYFIENLSQYQLDNKYDEMKMIFQAYYLGNRLFENTYNQTPPVNMPKGAITNEKLFITQKQLGLLKDKYGLMGIVTGRPKAEAKYVLEKNGIDQYFDVVIALEDTEKGKPDPEPINMAISILKLANTVYIGDSPSDVAAAKDAGIPSLYIGEDGLGDKNFADINNLLKFLL